MKGIDNEKEKRRKKRKERFKRFKRNLRLAKWETHFRVWKRDFISSILSESKDISLFCFIRFNGFIKKNNCRKKSVKKFTSGRKGSMIKITKPFFVEVGYVYFKFHGSFPNQIKIIIDEEYEQDLNCKFLHQLFKINKVNKSISFVFGDEVCINRLYVFSKGNQLPSWVQKWNEPCVKADLLAMSTHSDDEQLFFAGVLPLIVAKGKSVQLSYFAPPVAVYRFSELLDGLWQIGIRNYPVFSTFAEGWSESYEEAKKNLLETGTSENDVKKYIVATIRRFRPEIVLGQDPNNGEYGHGQHMYFAKQLFDSICLTGNPDFDFESLEKFGEYSVPQLYLHLFPNNRIVLDLDKPMEKLGGLTPFQVSQEGFSRHRTQYVSFFPRFLYGTIRHPIKKAAQIDKYSPCKWGLAYSGKECGSEDNYNQ